MRSNQEQQHYRQMDGFLSTLKYASKHNVEHKTNWTWEATTFGENSFMNIS